MASKTRRALIDQVLDNLGILVPGQAPSDESVEKVDLLLDPALASLAAQEIVYVADAGTPAPPALGEIDESIFLALADLVAWRCAPKFNLAGDAALALNAKNGEEELRIIGRPARTRRTLSTDIQLRAGNRRYAGFNFLTGR